MQIAKSKRLEGIGEYYFSQKLREIEQLNKAGKNIINLGIGSPDLPPHPSVIKVLQEQAGLSNTHAYQSYKGVAALRNAIAGWYQNWYQVNLNPDTEILPLLGSKEGIMHICMTYLNEGDQALIPNPGYPTYTSAVKLAGGTPVYFELTEESNWEPNFDKLEAGDLSKVKLMWVNYPQMPTGKKPTIELFQKLIAFGKKHEILICHDNPYSFILNDAPMSLLSVAGAMDTAIELNSLSKSQNMAGWRIGTLCGAEERINDVLTFKSNMDSGMFLPVQHAAVAALSLGADWYHSVNEVYAKRREKVFELLDVLACKYSMNQVGMFVWAKIPENIKDGYELSDQVLYKSNVFITPGGIFGSAGNQYIRVSLCGSISKFEEAIQRIEAQKAN
ncbi:pyridoxal phosphate-dependent aminotransferase [Sediminibacterium sp.]|jgi:aspartate/methionine/tyrosine aminotransferase|uniref:pyridoxal phosphate-dependent aminotransferase n=1 Tax=Sediminibacterium sp. TaxID=1917865 RepID=UPI00271D443C|nr:aminotransferase class I/II-fold pyridoxal phosphate-dependent enzyme [Sediminibacterium sp.]MDO8995385.1 aminotransferase class I/II-fold pyridoxal phosphate-dependent enzyme [Sediminibacterium sp.]MDP1972264.1 aminotransferase class I/II-fold pyridoxal phosphate-dependent enzyme [Sediminibacterium sp.]MDP2421136.1 aminotransferase class I/II-fold pyridoxal phosphate-dependent enzyme [Sediminibacterium sp.]